MSRQYIYLYTFSAKKGKIGERNRSHIRNELLIIMYCVKLLSFFIYADKTTVE